MGILAYDVFFVVLVYIFQLEHVHSAVGDYTSRILGIVHFQHVTYHDWPVFVGYIASLLLLLLVPLPKKIF